MSFVAPKKLGGGTAEQTNTVATFILDGPALNNAHPLSGLDVSIPADTYFPSIRFFQTSVDTPAGVIPAGVSAPTRGSGLQLMSDAMIIRVVNEFTSTWQLLSRSAAYQYYTPDFIQTLTGVPSEAKIIGNSGFPIYRYPDGSLHVLFSVLRPYYSALSGNLGFRLYVWYPFSMSIEVQGFQLSNFSPSLGAANVAACVEDTLSKNLYKSRPASGDIQSDFVETQKQCIRVAEQVEWQANMVLKDTFEIPYNPSVKRGQTILLKNSNKGISHLGIVKSVNHTFDVNSGKASTQVEIKCTEYIFHSALGSVNPDENIDQRA